MNGNVNWDGVWQSIVDTWLPLFGWIIIIIIAIIIIVVIRKGKSNVLDNTLLIIRTFLLCTTYLKINLLF